MASDEHRIAGIDRRTIVPALLVLALAVLLSVVLPSIASETAYHDEVHTGDVAAIADGVTLVPTPGWDLTGGVLAGRTRSAVGNTAVTQLVDGSVSFVVHAAPFGGTPSALLTRVNEINDKLNHARGSGPATDRYPVTTRQGVLGVAEDFVGVENEGSVVAFVFGSPGREGVEIVVSGPKGPISRRRDEIAAMIRSLRAPS